MNEKDRKFFEARRRIQKFWPIAGFGVPLFLIGFYVYMMNKYPILVKCQYTLELIKTDQMKPDVKDLLAAVCPIIINYLFVIVGVFILYLWGWTYIEKKYLRIIGELMEKKDKPE